MRADLVDTHSSASFGSRGERDRRDVRMRAYELFVASLLQRVKRKAEFASELLDRPPELSRLLSITGSGGNRGEARHASHASRKGLELHRQAQASSESGRCGHELVSSEGEVPHPVVDVRQNE